MLKWMLKVRPEGKETGGFTVQLALAGPVSDGAIDLVTGCSSLERFQLEIARLKEELDQVLREAEGQIKALAADSGMQDSPASDPEGVWKKMQTFASPEEMFEHFNSFDESSRQQIADYILGHASMFKGWGPVFAEHYDLATHRLEE